MDKEETDLGKTSQIVKVWSLVFQVLSTISLYQVLRKALLRRFDWAQGAGFVEAYVAVQSLLSVLALVIASARIATESTWLLMVGAFYAAFRIFEITVYQVNVLLFDQYRAKVVPKPYALRGYRRILILLLHNYFEIVCWFGLIYVYLYRDQRLAELVPEPSFFGVFRESMLLMFSFNPYRYQPAEDIAVFAFSAQAAIGLLMTIIVFARFLSLLPPPATLDPMEK